VCRVLVEPKREQQDDNSFCKDKWKPFLFCLFSDPFLVSLVQDVLKELVSNPLCTASIQRRVLPTLSSIVTAPAEKVSPGLTSVSKNYLEKIF
jgi:hypothetical protein